MHVAKEHSHAVLREEELERRERLLEKKLSRLEMTANEGVRAKYINRNVNDIEVEVNEEEDEDEEESEDENDDCRNREDREMNFKDHSNEGQSRRVLYYLCTRSPMSLISKVNHSIITS